jgi:hypothetical protein
MEMLNKLKAWAGALADVGVSLAALAIVLEVLGMQSGYCGEFGTASNQ